MDKHLKVFVLAHVVVAVLEHGTRVARRQVLGDERECLLVALHELALRGIGHTADARRQHIVDGLLVVVLLDVHGADLERSADGGCLPAIERLLVVAPVGLHEVECGEAQDDGFLEACQIHPDEADGVEILNASLGTFELFEGHAELEPPFGRLLAVAQVCRQVADI